MTDYDTRVYILGNLKLMTGTFTLTKHESISYDGVLGTVLASGGHIEDTTYRTNVRIDNGSGYAVGSTSMTVKTQDPRIHFNVDEDLYNLDGKRLGKITNLGSTNVTVDSLLVALSNNDGLNKFGPQQPSITLVHQDFNVNVDTTAKRVTFTFGSLGASDGDAGIMNGRFWILGTR